jgi:hypothetical protein
LSDAYSAAAVLFAARIYAPLHDDISHASLEASWHLCLDVLKANTQVSKSARRCVAALNFLDQIIASKKSDASSAAPHQDLASGAPAQIPISNASTVDTAHESHAFFLDETLQPGGFDFYNAEGVQDTAWSNSISVDLLQLGTGYVFG